MGESLGEVRDALASVTGALERGEDRPGQTEMAEAVTAAIERGEHLLVQAGTGTGKSLAYLLPVLLSETPTIVATATKALQDQLAQKDLPFLSDHLDLDFSHAVLKGRANYACRQRLKEVAGDRDQLALDGITTGTATEQIDAIAAWAETSDSGDRAELDFEPLDAAWSAISVSARECPGAARCPSGTSCFAEAARTRAAEADVVVVNTHLYGLDLSSNGAILPEHEVVVIDEAHQLEDVISATAGVELNGGRFRALRRSVAAIVEDPELIDAVEERGDRFDEALAPHVGKRLRGALDAHLATAIATAGETLTRVLAALRAVPDTDLSPDVAARKMRAQSAATALADDLDAIANVSSADVAWVEGPSDRAALRVAPIDVGELLATKLWGERTAILTSATLAPGLGERLGLDPDEFTDLDVGSPFDYETNALLYCASHLPDPRADDYEEELHRELEALILSAGGRTLALFTSWRAMRAAAEALEPRLPWPLYTQSDLPKPALLRAFSEEEESSLFATMGFWQGVDVPGPSLTLVTIDRIPFPRPDDPLLQARRERARADAFRVVDLPRAAMLIAQGAGRLIRASDDRGVVAVLDSRLATAPRYRWDLVNALPPMKRTKDREEALQTLKLLHDGESTPNI